MRLAPDRDGFAAMAQSALDRRAAALDELSLARLRAARRCALDAAARQSALVGSLRAVRSWLGLHLWQGGMLASVMAALLAAALWQTLSHGPGPLADGDMDMELLTHMEHLDLYENLEFYEWLSGNPNAG